MTEDQEQRIADLTNAAEQIAAGINELNRETGGTLIDLAVKTKRNRIMIWALALSLVLDVLLTLFVVNLTVRVDEAQKLTKTQVLCPLYQQFINADTPKARELAKKTGQDLKNRDQAFRVIHQSYSALGCASQK